MVKIGLYKGFIKIDSHITPVKYSTDDRHCSKPTFLNSWDLKINWTQIFNPLDNFFYTTEINANKLYYSSES